MTTTKIRLAFAALALAVAGASNASTINWGSLTAPTTKNFSNEFDSLHDVGDFSDRYNFTLTGAAGSFGGVTESDSWNSVLDINVISVSLYLGSTLVGIDWTPNSFSFANLGAGSYSFFVNGSIGTEHGSHTGEVGYSGSISFKPAPVPEPGSLALTGIGLLGLALAMRRRLFG